MTTFLRVQASIKLTDFQAVFYQLRGHKEEHNTQRREYFNRMQIKAQSDAAQANAAGGPNPPTGADGAQPPVANPDVTMAVPPADGIKHAWDMAEELVNLLKTAHPLLALTMEQFAEQIRDRLKPGPEEEVYRMSGALLQEALNVSVRLKERGLNLLRGRTVPL
jgi:transformation/transcription domain-associated protein